MPTATVRWPVRRPVRILGPLFAALVLVALLDLEIWGYYYACRTKHRTVSALSAHYYVNEGVNVGNVHNGGGRWGRLSSRVERVSRSEQAHSVDPIARNAGTFDQNDRLLAEVSALHLHAPAVPIHAICDL